MPGKPITDEGIAKDVGYILEGTIYHQWFSQLCPPRVGLEVLEPGCGSGKFALWYWLYGANVRAWDIDPEVLEYARTLRGALSIRLKEIRHGSRMPPGEMSFALGDINKLTASFGPEFDFVFNEGISHHWPRNDVRRRGSVRQMAAVTKPGGTVAAVVSNAHCPEMMEYARTVAHTYMSMPPTQTPFHKGELRETLEEAGLTDVQVEPVESPEIVEARTLIAWGRKP